MAEREFEYQNPDDPYATPYASAPPPSDPWSSDEANAATAQFQQFLSTHPGYGDSSDGLRQYQALRQQGQSHDAALSGAFSSLGWVDRAPAPTAPPPGPAPTAGPAPGPTLIDSGTPGQPLPAPTAPPPGSTVGAYTPPPAYVKPPAFSYGDFVAPTGDDVLNDPGYGFELGQGIQAIGAKNAALGTLNTGGTIKDFMGFGQNLASTKYNDLFNRKLTGYQTNRGNALDAYNTNYGTQYKDPYSINYASQYSDPFAFNLQGMQANNQNNQFYAGLNQSTDQFGRSLNQNQRQFTSNLDWQKFLQNYKATVTDPFDQKYKITSLY